MRLTGNSVYIAVVISALSCVANAADISISRSSQQIDNPNGDVTEATLPGRERSFHKGDEWEYASTDMFGKKQTLIARVLEPTFLEGSLEEFGVRRGAFQEFSFTRQPTVFFNGADSIVWFSPYWNGKDLKNTKILNEGACSTLQYVSGCNVHLAEHQGSEKISVAAGTFSTEKLRIEISLHSQYGPGHLIMNIWYSSTEQRIIRQTIRGRHSIAEGWPNLLNDQIELVAIRKMK